MLYAKCPMKDDYLDLGHKTEKYCHMSRTENRGLRFLAIISELGIVE